MKYVIKKEESMLMSIVCLFLGYIIGYACCEKKWLDKHYEGRKRAKKFMEDLNVE